MSTRDIRTSIPQTVCDVCGRTLLRGEHAEVYVNGGARQSVCELCKPRAVQEGWVRDGTALAYDAGDASSDRRRSLLSRLLSRRDSGSSERAAPAPDGDLDGAVRGRGAGPVREPRHVRAVPTSIEQKIASAVELFNSSEHRRTVAGVSRSLGMPTVSLRPSGVRPSVVNMVVSWELCWYRYEVDLSDDQPSVRVAGQGYELEDLAAQERQPNAVSDEHGSLSLSS